jgi:hypothetical protein
MLGALISSQFAERYMNDMHKKARNITMYHVALTNISTFITDLDAKELISAFVSLWVLSGLLLGLHRTLIHTQGLD